jgi:hypothetical protein
MPRHSRHPRISRVPRDGALRMSKTTPRSSAKSPGPTLPGPPEIVSSPEYIEFLNLLADIIYAAAYGQDEKKHLHEEK